MFPCPKTNATKKEALEQVDEWMKEWECIKERAKFIFSVTLWAPVKFFNFSFLFAYSGFLAKLHMREIAHKERHWALWHLTLQEKEQKRSEAANHGSQNDANPLIRGRVTLATSLFGLFRTIATNLWCCFFFQQDSILAFIQELSRKLIISFILSDCY